MIFPSGWKSSWGKPLSPKLSLSWIPIRSLWMRSVKKFCASSACVWVNVRWRSLMPLDAYAPIVGDATIEELRLIAKKLSGRVIKNINSTAVGGGVAEILNQMVPLFKEMGIDARWDVIRGGD